MNNVTEKKETTLQGLSVFMQSTSLSETTVFQELWEDWGLQNEWNWLLTLQSLTNRKNDREEKPCTVGYCISMPIEEHIECGNKSTVIGWWDRIPTRSFRFDRWLPIPIQKRKNVSTSNRRAGWKLSCRTLAQHV